MLSDLEEDTEDTSCANEEDDTEDDNMTDEVELEVDPGPDPVDPLATEDPPIALLVPAIPLPLTLPLPPPPLSGMDPGPDPTPKTLPATGLLTAYFEFPNCGLPRPGSPLPPSRPPRPAIPGPLPGPTGE